MRKPTLDLKCLSCHHLFIIVPSSSLHLLPAVCFPTIAPIRFIRILNTITCANNIGMLRIKVTQQQEPIIPLEVMMLLINLPRTKDVKSIVMQRLVLDPA